MFVLVSVCVLMAVWVCHVITSQSCPENFGGATMPWAPTRESSLAEICTNGIQMQLQQGGYTVTMLLEHVK